MKALALDSNAVISLFDGDSRILELMNAADQVLLPAVVIAEVKLGINGTKRGKMTEVALERLLDRPNVSVLAVTLETTSRFVEIMRYLKANGTPIPTNDVWIAAGVMERNADLLTMDGHFSNVPMIHVVH